MPTQCWLAVACLQAVACLGGGAAAGAAAAVGAAVEAGAAATPAAPIVPREWGMAAARATAGGMTAARPRSARRTQPGGRQRRTQPPPSCCTSCGCGLMPGQVRQALQQAGSPAFLGAASSSALHFLALHGKAQTALAAAGRCHSWLTQDSLATNAHDTRPACHLPAAAAQAQLAPLPLPLLAVLLGGPLAPLLRLLLNNDRQAVLAGVCRFSNDDALQQGPRPPPSTAAS